MCCAEFYASPVSCKIKEERITTKEKIYLHLFYLGSSDVTSFLMTEARQHNTEIRLAVGKVADKVDHLASKVYTL